MSGIVSSVRTLEQSSQKSASLLLGIPLYVYACVVASLSIVVGILWDISWHITIGRDGLFSAPHVVVYAGSAFAGLLTGIQCLKTSFWGNTADKNRSVRFWVVFYSSLGGLFCIWGSIAALTSAPFDDWWHAAYGLDVEIFTPPHTILLLGLMMIQLGAMLIVMAILNRAEPIKTLTKQQNAGAIRRLRLLFMLTAAFLLAECYLFTSEFISSSHGHTSLYYQVSGFIFPLILLSTGRASGHRWGRTIISLIYMSVLLITNWILQQFPAEPLLGPILNPVSHFQFYGFPVLLVIPALACDWVSMRIATQNDWTQSLVLAITFMAVYILIQWYFSEFLFTSAFARNKVFGSYQWYYGSDPNWEYRFKYHPRNSESLTQLAKGLGIATLITILSTRMALAWGNWMKRVVR
ncbi:MAG: hypothetical protein QM669_01900 [Siphonobacter sp.]